MLSLTQIEKENKTEQNMILCILKAHNFVPFLYGSAQLYNLLFFKQGSFLALTLLAAEVSLVFTVGEERKQKRQNMKTKEHRNNKEKPPLGAGINTKLAGGKIPNST